MNQDTPEEVCVVDIDEENSLPISVEDNRSRGESFSRPKPKIQKVLPLLRDNQNLRKFFQPKVVAFGPIHHGAYSAAEEFKHQWAEEFAKKTGQDVECIKKNIKENIVELRGCYADEVVECYKDEELAEILRVDGCALLYYMRCVEKRKPEKLKITLDRFVYVEPDMLLLENQLPFEVLDLLVPKKDQDSWMKWIESFLDSLTPFQKQPNVDHPELLIDLKGKKPTHLLEFLRGGLLCPGESPFSLRFERQEVRMASTFRKDSLRSAVELKASGIKFKENRKCQGLNDIKVHKNFCSLTVEAPYVRIDHSSWPIFMNLIAFEWCSESDNEIIAYLAFLDTLIDYPEDVKELRKAKILTNNLKTDEELSQLFNDIGTYLRPFTKWQYDTIREEIQNHFDRQWKVQFAEFRNTYFSSPWSFTAFITALIIFVLTIIQTYFTIWPLKDGGKLN